MAFGAPPVSDGSQFTTGEAENPTLTIVALATRQAEYMADQMAKHCIQLARPYRCATCYGTPNCLAAFNGQYVLSTILAPGKSNPHHRLEESRRHAKLQ